MRFLIPPCPVRRSLPLQTISENLTEYFRKVAEGEPDESPRQSLHQKVTKTHRLVDRCLTTESFFSTQTSGAVGSYLSTLLGQAHPFACILFADIVGMPQPNPLKVVTFFFRFPQRLPCANICPSSNHQPEGAWRSVIDG